MPIYHSCCHFLLHLLVLAVGLCGVMTTAKPALARSGLVSNQQAQRYGLVRAWFSQAQVDRSRHMVERAVLSGDQLIVLTTAGVLHAMDAHTGGTDWVARVGNPDYPSLGPAISDEYVAIVNGSTITVLDRETGLEKMSRELSGGAGGGPALANDHVYVPMFTGKLEAYPLTPPMRSTWYYSSTGRVFESASATSASITWPTDRGYLYVANPSADGVRYRFQSSGRVLGSPAAAGGNLYLTTTTGFLYALDERTGKQLWRYGTGSSISQPPVVVGGRVYVATETGAMHCVSARTGDGIWQSPNIHRLAAVSASRVYGMNRMGDLIILDKQSGVPLGRIATNATTTSVVNDQTDRVYLVSDSGLVQCLHEIGSQEPLRHSEAAPAAEEVDEGADAADTPVDEPRDQPTTEETNGEPAPVNPFGEPADTANPFGGSDDSANPFGGSDDAASDNPFEF